MSLPDEIERLHRLREAGALTDAEFAAAKRRLIEGPAATTPAGGGAADELGRTANRYVSHQREQAKFGLVWGVIVLVVFLILVFTVFVPQSRRFDRHFEGFPTDGPTFVRP